MASARTRRTLSPYPSGWYVLAFARELARGRVLTRTLGGTELVLFRTDAGQVAALDAHCPHMGAHLGRGGVVERECIRRFVLEAHPQETTENSVDLGHFSWVHGYRNVRMLRDVVTDGAFLSTAYAAERAAPLVGHRLHFDFEFETRIHGLGYSMVEVAVQGFDVRARLWVLPTPLDDERIALYLAASGDGGGRPHPALRAVPGWLRARLIGRGLLMALVQDARQDFEIWAHKRWVDPPALAQGDGPIGRYRSWARQFYPPPVVREARAVRPVRV